MIAVAAEDLARSPASNVSFAVADVEADGLGGTYDYAFARCGVMFFAHPVPAFRNIRAHLAPGGELCLIVWRRKLDNEWVRRTEEVVAKYVEHPEESDVPTCGPGPFAMANADTVSDQLMAAGFERVTLARHDFAYRIGGGLDEAVSLNMSLGPAAEVLRQWGDRIDDIRPSIEADIRAALSEYVDDDGAVRAGGSVWIISARAPR
jgi:SAM-dependent methyltransferase